MSGSAIGQVGFALVRALDDSDVSPGVLGFVVVALLGVATWLLIRSMTKQLRRIRIPDSEGANGADDARDPGGADEADTPVQPRSPGDG